MKGNVHIPFFRQNLSDRAVLFLFNYVGTLKMYELFQIVKDISTCQPIFPPLKQKVGRDSAV